MHYIRICARTRARLSAELNQTLYYLIGNSIIRLVVIDYLSPQTVERIGNMRPLPSYYAIYANTKQMEELFKTVRLPLSSSSSSSSTSLFTGFLSLRSCKKWRLPRARVAWPCMRVCKEARACPACRMRALPRTRPVLIDFSRALFRLRACTHVYAIWVFAQPSGYCPLDWNNDESNQFFLYYIGYFF